ncbi:MAG: redoxin domain-containing protein [Planctomycetes bacterium]|nr:redoxin domain-containing protein [Planctomycetota bacterium]
MEEWKDKPFALVGVNSDQTVERAKKAIEENDLNWRSFQNRPKDAERAISDDWAVRGWPTVVVLDPEMKIRYRGHDGDAATKVARGLIEAMQ